jgi:hypothetical protein
VAGWLFGRRVRVEIVQAPPITELDTPMSHLISLWNNTRVRATLLPMLSLVAVVLAGGAGTKWT